MLIWVIIFIKQGDNTFRSVMSKAAKHILIAISIWMVLLILDVFRSGFTNDWLEEVLLKIPLIVIPVYLLFLPKDTCSFTNSWLIFTLVTTAVGFVSTVHYWLNYEEINALLLQSKHVPIFGNMHHIYFGVIVSLCIWLCVHFYKKDMHRKIWLVCGILLLVFMHILASRTGIVAFYSATLIYIFAASLKAKRYTILIIGVCGLVLLPIIGYQVSGSFKNKVANSVEDFNAVQSGQDINYKSLAMRIEAWKTSGRVIAKNPITGVGASRVDDHLQQQYRIDETVLYPENRVGPHNQFIEMTLAHGIVGGLLLLFIVLIWLINVKHSPAILAGAVVIIMSFLLESFLERQQGILVFCLFLFSFIQLPSKK